MSEQTAAEAAVEQENGGATATAAVVNPYLKKKAKQTPQELPVSSLILPYKSSIQEDDANVDEEGASEVPLQEAAAATSGAEPEEGQQEQAIVHTSTTHRASLQEHGQEFSIEQRLPSRIVSFQSAEHLSVSELHSFRAYYCGGGSSVRITGVILHRHVAETDASICLVLGDPLTGARPPVAKNNNRRSSFGGSSLLRTPTPRKQVVVTPGPRATPSAKRRQNHGASGATMTSSSAVKGTLEPAKTPLHRKNKLMGDETLLSGLNSVVAGSKRKLVHIPKATPGTNKLLSRRINSGSSYNKRRLSFSTPTESAINSLVNQTTLLVILNPLQHPQAASDCGVGDNVMIIGELILRDPSSSKVARPFLSQYQKRLERDDDPSVRYILPRIVRNVNGTNVRLQYDALVRRRDHVLELCNNNPNQPGRGPPRVKPVPQGGDD